MGLRHHPTLVNPPHERCGLSSGSVVGLQSGHSPAQGLRSASLGRWIARIAPQLRRFQAPDSTSAHGSSCVADPCHLGLLPHQRPERALHLSPRRTELRLPSLYQVAAPQLRQQPNLAGLLELPWAGVFLLGHPRLAAGQVGWRGNGAERRQPQPGGDTLRPLAPRSLAAIVMGIGSQRRAARGWKALRSGWKAPASCSFSSNRASTLPHITQFGPYAYRANASQYFNLLWPVCLGFWWTLNRSFGSQAQSAII